METRPYDDVRIRPVRGTDASELAALHVRTSRMAHADIMPPHLVNAMTVAQRERRWIDIWTKAGADDATLVAEQDRRLIGFGHCSRQRDASLPFAGEFCAVYVQPEMQRRGTGRALMQAMARFLVSRGITAASLWVMRDNRGARRFYEIIGGRLVAEKGEARGGVTIAEVAYGWDDLGPLCGDGAALPGGRRATT